MQLRLGILGLSPGNGHPYSWSAIFNGYDCGVMAGCPFPVIPDYLSRQSFPEDAISGASVEYVWTEDRAMSEHVAKAARIAHVVDHYGDMIGKVDAVLLARDDAETHYEMAAPFLAAGLPIYVDKPLALSVAEAERLYACQRRPGLLFSRSALAYARELRPEAAELDALGPLRYVEAVSPKDWAKYAIHAIDPLLDNLRGRAGRVVETRASGQAVRRLDVRWESGLEGRILTMGTPHCPIELRLFGEEGFSILRFQDTFAAFRASLQHFTDIVAGRRPAQDPAVVLDSIALLEAAIDHE